MKKLLIICGPTATGKTSLALHLAKVFDGELVSADSRQVYRDMNIGTGKDLPLNPKYQISDIKWKRKKLGFYKINGVRIWGYDLVGPTEEFSVAHYVEIADRIIKHVWQQGKLPILVGGTGFYIKALVDGLETLSIVKDEFLRKSLKYKEVSELFEILIELDPLRARSMNRSDKKNPHRLVRAIEVAKAGVKADKARGFSKCETLFIGLIASKEALFKKIDQRIKKRVKAGIEGEIKELLKKGISWHSQAMSSLGYRQWKGFFKGNKTKKQVISEWKKEEQRYARRQITWFKSDKRINWFDITRIGWQKNLDKLLKKWYS